MSKQNRKHGNKRNLYTDPKSIVYKYHFKIVKRNYLLSLFLIVNLPFFLISKGIYVFYIELMCPLPTGLRISQFLIHFYRLLIPSKLFCRCIAKWSARKSYMKLFDSIHHQRVRLCNWEFVHWMKRVCPGKYTYQTWFAVCNQFGGLSNVWKSLW